MAQLLEPFAYEYMVNAMWVSALVGAVCAFLSAYLMLKGWSLIGDALSHSIVPGVAGAYMLGLPFALGAFIAGVMLADSPYRHELEADVDPFNGGWRALQVTCASTFLALVGVSAWVRDQRLRARGVTGLAAWRLGLRRGAQIAAAAALVIPEATSPSPS